MVRHVLLLDEARLSAYRVGRGRIEREDEFLPGDEDLARFADYLASRRGQLFMMLADVSEQSFQVEDVPYLRGGDRAALLKHRLARHYPSTPLAAALTLGRRTDGRRDERMLFSALTGASQFEPWLDALASRQATLAGIFSLPQLATVLPGCGSGSFLLITLGRGGLRQTFIADGGLRFSRLASLPSASPDELARATGREAANIGRYLDAQGLLAADGPLTVRVLAHSAHMGSFRAHCIDSGELRYEYIELDMLAARCGLETPPTDSSADALFAFLLVRRTPRVQFADDERRRPFRLRQAHARLRYAAVAAILACLAFAGFEMFEFRRLEAATILLGTATEATQRRHEAMRASGPALPLAAARLLAVTARYDGLLQASPGPGPLYRLIASALDASPDITLERLNWSLTTHGDAGQADAGGGTFAAVELEASLPLGTSADYDAQAALVGEFVARLRRNAGLDVRTLSLPADVESGKSLSSAETPPAAAPTFTLLIRQRLGG